MSPQPVETDAAPAAIGPYAQAVRAGPWLFVSGQLGLDPKTGDLVAEDAPAQARQALHNLGVILQAAGAEPSDVVKTTVYLAHLGEFAAVNAVYGEFFGKWRPARATVEVARLPKEARVEIDAVAVLARSPIATQAEGGG